MATRTIPKPESTSGGITDLSTGATGTLPVSNGGTGVTTFTTNTLYKGNGTGVLLPSSITDDGSVVKTTESFMATPTTTSPILVGNTTPVATLTGVTITNANPSVLTKDATIDDGVAVGDLVIVTGGSTGGTATTGLYRVASIVANVSVTLDRQAATVGNVTDGAITIYKDVIAITPTDGTNGQMITSYSHQDHPLQLGGSYLIAPAADATANAVIIPDIHFFGGSRIVDASTTGNMYISGKGQIAFSTGSTIAAQRWNILSAGHLVANNDNTYNIGASGATRPKDIYMAGVLYGNRNYVVTKTGNAVLTEAEVQNSIIRVTSAATLTLPAVSATLVGSRFTVHTIGAIAVSVDPNASDRIYLSGTALTDGNKITNSSTSGDFVEIYCDSTDGWSTLNMGGTWVDGGA